MNRNIIVLSFLLLVSVFNGFAQQACDLMLVPEGNNLCILERHSYDFSVIKACRGNTVNYRAFSPTAISYEWTVVGGEYQLLDRFYFEQIYLDELHYLDGVCAWTENFTPPTEPY